MAVEKVFVNANSSVGSNVYMSKRSPDALSLSPFTEACGIMMGQHSRSESLFYYFRIEDQVPENHLLRRLQSRRAAERGSTPEKFPPSYRV